MHGKSHESSHLQVWFCAECDSVHLRTHHVSLSFSLAEFADLSHAVTNIYRDEIAEKLEARMETPKPDKILESDLIS